MILDHKLKVVFHWLPGQQFYYLYWWTQLFLEHRDQIECFCEKSIFLTPLENLYPLPERLTPEVRNSYAHILILRDPYERLHDVFTEMMDHPEGAKFINERNLNSFEELAQYIASSSDTPLPWFRPQMEWAQQLKGCTVYPVEYADLRFQLATVMLRLGYFTAPEAPWEQQPVQDAWTAVVNRCFVDDLSLFGLEPASGVTSSNVDTDKADKSIISFPFVSVLTPTYKRKDWLKLLQQCLLNQSYPLECFEWIIFDDSPEEFGDFVPDPRLNIKYVREHEQVVLGDKRNQCAKWAKGSILIPCDDDDYMHPERITHAVNVLQTHPEAMLAYTPSIPLYDLQTEQLIVVNCVSPQRSVGGSWAYRKILTEARQYKSNAFAEEYGIVDRHLPTAELDGWKTLISLAHPKNTVSRDKAFSEYEPLTQNIEALIPPSLLAAYRQLRLPRPT